MKLISFNESGQVIGSRRGNDMQWIFIKLEISLLAESKGYAIEISTCLSVFVVLHSWNLIETIATRLLYLY
jgi:hypothetical protein